MAIYGENPGLLMYHRTHNSLGRVYVAEIAIRYAQFGYTEWCSQNDNLIFGLISKYHFHSAIRTLI